MGMKAIFYARREGRLDDAYAMCKEVMPDFSALTDSVEISAVGWTLIDLIKRANRRGEDASIWRRELESLPIEDALLKEKAAHALQPAELLKADALTKEGKLDEAERLYEALLKADPDNADAQTGLGWLICRRINGFLASSSPDVAEAKRLMMRYLGLKKIFKPSALHSAVLLAAVRLAKGKSSNFSMLNFLRLWDTDAFHVRDWSGRQDFEPLAAQAVYLAAREAATDSKKGRPPSEETADFLREKLLPLFAAAAESSRHGSWFRLYETRIELWLGNTVRAHELGIALVREKSSEGWAWDLLGDAARTVSPDESAAFFMKGIVLSAEEAFTVRMRLKLARLLFAAERYSDAKFQVSRAEILLRNLGKPLPADVRAFSKSPDYTAAPQPTSDEALKDELLPKAEAALAGELDWIRAIVGRTFAFRNHDGTEKALLSLCVESERWGVTSVLLSPKALGNFRAKPGMPVKVKGVWEERKFRLLGIETRDDGAAWDLLASRPAVVDSVREEQRFFLAFFGMGESAVLDLGILDGLKVRTGDVVRVYTVRRFTKVGERIDYVAARRTDERPEAVVTVFEGRFRPVEGRDFAFADVGSGEAVFVPRELLGQFRAGDRVCGVAIAGRKSRKAVALRGAEEENDAGDDYRQAVDK